MNVFSGGVVCPIYLDECFYRSSLCHAFTEYGSINDPGLVYYELLPLRAPGQIFTFALLYFLQITKPEKIEGT